MRQVVEFRAIEGWAVHHLDSVLEVLVRLVAVRSLAVALPQLDICLHLVRAY